MKKTFNQRKKTHTDGFKTTFKKSEHRSKNSDEYIPKYCAYRFKIVGAIVSSLRGKIQLFFGPQRLYAKTIHNFPSVTSQIL